MLYSGKSLAWHWMGVLSKQNENKEYAAGKAYQQIGENLLNGNWPPEYVLPGEYVLKEEMDVGRHALREAITFLELCKVLIKEHGKRSVVAKNFKPELLPSNPFAKGPLSPKEFQDMQIFRQSVEVKCAELAAENATDEDIEALERAINDMRENVNDTRLFCAADCRFHYALIRATGNFAFIRAAEAIRGMYESYLNEVNQHCTDMTECMDAHTQVFNAIKNGDPQAAGKAMASLVAMSIQQTKKQPDNSR